MTKQGYQICQSLFAIGTGGWFGMGLYQGMPDKIPVVEQDFVFAAISEELGGVFALCLLLVCVSCYLMFLNIAMQIKDQFYKLIALGLGTVYGFQVFLTIGGVTKFIPSTGVTLPLVSYGGSSLLSTTIIFAIIQGLYILRQDEEGMKQHEGKKKKKVNVKEKRTKREPQRKPEPGCEDQLPETDAKKPDSTRTSKTSTRNREFVVITYAFLGIFIALMGYFAYFETVKSEDFINSPYNARQDSFSRQYCPWKNYVFAAVRYLQRVT